MTFTIRGRIRELEAEILQFMENYRKSSALEWPNTFLLERESKIEAKIKALKEAAEAVEARVGELENTMKNIRIKGFDVSTPEGIETFAKFGQMIGASDELRRLLGAEGE